MTSSPLNPSQHVERIREILIGRDLQNMHGRILRIEGALEKSEPAEASSNLQEAMTELQNQQTALRQELQVQRHQSNSPQTRSSLLSSPPHASDHLASELAARIDARFREVLTHLQNELIKLKGQLDDDLNSLKFEKADRSELNSRFARLASAATEVSEADEEKKPEGFLP